MDWFDSAFAQTLVGALAGVLGAAWGARYSSRQAAELARVERDAAAKQIQEDRITTQRVAALDRLHGDRSQLIHELRAPSAVCTEVYVTGTRQLKIIRESEDTAQVLDAASAFMDKYSTSRDVIDHGLFALTPLAANYLNTGNVTKVEKGYLEVLASHRTVPTERDGAIQARDQIERIVRAQNDYVHEAGLLFQEVIKLLVQESNPTLTPTSSMLPAADL